MFRLFGWVLYLVSFILWPFRRFFTRRQGIKYEVKITGVGRYLPGDPINNTEIVKMIQERGGGEILEKKRVWLSEKHGEEWSLEDVISNYYGIETRHWAAKNETGAQMAAEAAKIALAKAHLDASQISAVYYAAASFDKAIPDTGVFLHRELGMSRVPVHTTHSTCISFLHAMNNAIAQIESGRYEHIMVVSAEKTNFSLNPRDPKSFVIIGDAAAAVILSRSDNPDTSYVSQTHFSTYSTLAECVTMPLGNNFHPSQMEDPRAASMFRMDTKMLLEKVPGLAKDFLKLSGGQEYKFVVAHQPSQVAVEHLYQMFPKKRIVETFSQIGNCVAATIPYNLVTLVESGELNRGDRILLVGTGAGLGLGAIELAF